MLYTCNMQKIENSALPAAWLTEIQRTFMNYDIPEDEWEQFRNRLKGLKIERGEFLVQEGSPPEQIAFILSGIFRAFYLTEKGEERTIVFRDKGKVLSAYSSYIKDQPAVFSIQALEPGLLVYISIEEFENLLRNHPFWEMLKSRYIMDLFIDKEKRERSLLSDDAETRYKIFLNDYPGFIKRISHYYIASYLGISNVTLSRIRRDIKLQNS